MANHFKIPLLWPFKMVPATTTPGIHFDDAWACEQIKSFEAKAYYRQKWVKTETTKLQIESSLAPEPLKVYKTDGTVAKSIAWTAVHTEISYKIYECTFDISDLAEGIYYIYQQVTFGSIDWKTISEAIHSKTNWPGTLKFTYKNSFNKDDVAWTTGLQMSFRCEAGIMDFTPEAEITAYVNQTRDARVLDGTPFRTFKLYIGEAAGVAPYIVDIINRIFSCDYVSIEGMQYAREGNAKVEVTRVKGYPLIGASLEITPASNAQSLAFADTTPLAPGVVLHYNMETAFFGPGSLVPVIDVEEQG
mgnify:CR=1 FL=1